MKAGMTVKGPAIVLNNTSTILIEPEWLSKVDSMGNIEMDFLGDVTEKDIHFF